MRNTQFLRALTAWKNNASPIDPDLIRRILKLLETTDPVVQCARRQFAEAYDLTLYEYQNQARLERAKKKELATVNEDNETEDTVPEIPDNLDDDNENSAHNTTTTVSLLNNDRFQDYPRQGPLGTYSYSARLTTESRRSILHIMLYDSEQKERLGHLGVRCNRWIQTRGGSTARLNCIIAALERNYSRFLDNPIVGMKAVNFVKDDIQYCNAVLRPICINRERQEAEADDHGELLGQ